MGCDWDGDGVRLGIALYLNRVSRYMYQDQSHLLRFFLVSVCFVHVTHSLLHILSYIRICLPARTSWSVSLSAPRGGGQFGMVLYSATRASGVYRV